MILLLFLLAAIGVYISLQHFVIPRLEAKSEIARKTFHWSAVVAVFNYLRTTALLTSATYVVIIVAILVLSLNTPVTAAGLGATIGNIQWLQSKYKILRELWVLWLFLMILLAFIAYRRDKNAAEREKQSTRIDGKDVVEEQLPFLPPNEEMEEIARKIGECEQQAKRLEQSWIGTDDVLRKRLHELNRQKQQLQLQLHDADMKRRAPDNTPQADSPPRSRFFGSKGFVKTLQASTKSLGHLGTVLLAVCVIGVNVPVLDGHLNERVVHLTDLQVELTKEDALKSYKQATAEKVAPAAEPLSAEDHRIIDEIAHLFEEFFTSSDNFQDDEEDDNKGVAFFLRSNVVRDHILDDFRRDPPDATSKTGEAKPPDPKGPNGGGSRPTGKGSAPGKPPDGPRDSGKPSSGRTYDAPADRVENPPPRESTGKKRADPAPPAGVTANHSSTRPRAPQSRLGEQVADSLRTGVTGRPRLLDNFKSKLKAFKASFSEPLDPLDLGQLAVGEAIGVAVDNSWQTSNQGLDQVKKVGRTMFKDVAKNIFARAHRSGKDTFDKSVRRIYQTLMCRFFSDLGGSESLADALNHVRDGLTDRSVVTPEEIVGLRQVAIEFAADRFQAELLYDYKRNPSALDYNEAELWENQREAERLEKELQSRADKKLSSEELKAVDSYEDHYPGRLGAETKTPKGKLLAATRETKLLVDPESDKKSEKLLAQARDFKSLGQSVDVGGILMGRSPEFSQASVDFQDLRWTIENEAVTLFARRSDGSEIAFGPFEKSLVHQALAYAADDRKVVVTIISGGQGKRKVMLHPALVDTRLGHDIIEFDKLVFRFVESV